MLELNRFPPASGNAGNRVPLQPPCVLRRDRNVTTAKVRETSAEGADELAGDIERAEELPVLVIPPRPLLPLKEVKDCLIELTGMGTVHAMGRAADHHPHSQVRDPALAALG
jgi:hypothetical protein